MFLLNLLSLLACSSTASDNLTATPVDSGGALAPALDAAALVRARVSAAFPGAVLVDTEPVSWPDGAPLGELLVFAVDEPSPLEAECAALFCGAELYSVLASDLFELPFWVAATSGGPQGLPFGAELVYAPQSATWGWRRDGALEAQDAADLDALAGDWSPEPTWVEAWAAERDAAWQELLVPRSGCGSSYGTVLDSFQGVSAYSNGTCSGTGSGTYQCVEFTDRVHKVTASHSGNANSYNDGTAPRKMNMMYFTNNNGTYAPKRGDLVVSDSGTYGHVAIVDSTSSSAATLIDQNWSASSATHSVTLSSTKLGSMGSYTIAGWLRPGWDFGSSNLDTSSSVYGWTVLRATQTGANSTGVTINPSSDPGLRSPSGLYLHPVPSSAGGEGYGKVKIRLKSSAPDGNVRVYFITTTDSTWDESKAESTTVKTDGSWQTVTVDMSVNGYWVYGGRVNQIRVDPASNGNSGSSDSISIDAVWFEP